MTSDDITVRVLTEIRDSLGTLREALAERIDETNQRVDNLRVALASRIDETNARVDETNRRVTRLETRVTEGDLRLSSEVLAGNGLMRDIHALLRDRLDLRDRMDRAERDIDDLKKRVG